MAPRTRQRQDLDRVDERLRYMNDLSAAELYEQILLGYIRSGGDPNERTPRVAYEGYVAPTYDESCGRQSDAEHRQKMAEVLANREDVIRALRQSEEHRRLPAFDQLLCETEYWTGLREWNGEHSSQPNTTRRARSLGGTMDDDSSAMELIHLTETPSYIRGKLRPYQLEGVNWLLSLFSRGVNGILADEMGLGKTFQTIATLACLKYTFGFPGPHLVVCPKSVMGNWYREFRQWCPALSVYKFHGSGDIRPMLIRTHLQPTNALRYDVVITTFEMMLEELGAFRRIQWQYLIVDEAHKLKNEEGRAHGALASLSTTHRLIITGTPLQNNLKELWALLHFLAPRLFDNAQSFKDWFDTASGNQDTAAMDNMHKVLAPLMIRRLKADVNTGIPPKKEVYVACRMTKKQKEWYMNILSKDAEVLNKASGGSTSYLQNIIIHLRKVINHPYLMDGGEEGPPFVTDERLVKYSGKMIILDKLLKRLQSDKEGRHKVLLFSQFTMMLNVLEDYCVMRGIKYCRIDGNTSSYDRDSQMAAFNAPNSEYFLFLLSTRAGGLGINLQAANHVIIYDSDWNPQMDLQAQDRAHRIGQQRSVRVYRFVMDGTVEERIYRRALKKLYLDAVVVQQGRMQTKAASQASRDELMSMIKFGAAEMFKSRHEEVTEADIDRLLDEGEQKSDAMTKETKQAIQMSLASFQLGAEEANIYDFEGISYRAGVESRMLHISLSAPVALAELHRQCAEYGDVVRVVLHPNLTEALVSFRSTGGAVEAKDKLPYTCRFASKEAQMIVSGEMVSECFGAGEKLGRGHRVRDPVKFYTEEEVERIQSRVVKAPPMKLPRPPKFPPYQLYNTKRLLELHNTEVALLVRNWKRCYESKTSRDARAVAHGGAPTKDETDLVEEDEKLTDVELEERDRLMSEGFSTWTFQEYLSVRAALMSGRIASTDYPKIAEFVGSEKSVGEVRDYVVALLERGEACIPNFSSIEKRIQKAQKRVRSRDEMIQAAKLKIESCETPETDLVFRGKGPHDLNRQLFLAAYDRGFDEKNIAQVMKSQPANRFDVWLQSRSDNFFTARLRGLMQATKREWGDGPQDESPRRSRAKYERSRLGNSHSSDDD